MEGLRTNRPVRRCRGIHGDAAVNFAEFTEDRSIKCISEWRFRCRIVQKRGFFVSVWREAIGLGRGPDVENTRQESTSVFQTRCAYWAVGGEWAVVTLVGAAGEILWLRVEGAAARKARERVVEKC